MAVPLDDVRAALHGFVAGHPAGPSAFEDVRALLADGVDVVYGRSHPHLVATIAVIDDAGRTLHVRDHAGDTWTLPGGHARPTDHSLRGIALRALTEQTGVAAEAVEPLRDRAASDVSFHIPAEITVDGAHILFRYPYRHIAGGVPNTRVDPDTETHATVAWLAPDAADTTGPARTPALTR